MSWPLVALCWIALCGGQPAPGILDHAGARLRSVDARTAARLGEGRRRSPTFRRLVDAIARTDGIVYVAPIGCPIYGVRACLLHAVHADAGVRYLWIAAAALDDADEQIALIAHELQHALEVLQNPSLRTSQDILHFYRSANAASGLGASARSGGRAYETDAAILTGEAVRADLAGQPSAEEAAGVR